MELIIKKVENGFIITYPYEFDDDITKPVSEVFEEGSGVDNEKEVMTRLLERVADYFGLSYDRFGKENLNIKWDKKGHKVCDDE